MPGTIDKLSGQVCAAVALLAALVAAFLVCWGAATASAMPLPTRYVYGTGEIVPVPAAIPHEEGDMVDRRIVPDLRWIAKRFPILITDGYSGPLPSGEHAGCRGCHVRNSDHYNGLAVDIVPLNGSGSCDSNWTGITRLAQWAEPVQSKPRPPFRWVGYDGDAGHGCGHHLHLSWEHAIAPMFELAEWVEVFPVRNQGVAQEPQPQPKPQRKPSGSPSGVKPAKGPPGGSAAEEPSGDGPRGGVSVVQSGGVGPGD